LVNSGFIWNKTLAILNNPGTLTNTLNKIINNDGGTINNLFVIGNLGTIIECGIYTGAQPTPNGLTPCSPITDDIVLEQDLTYNCDQPLIVAPGALITVKNNSTLTVCGLIVNFGGGVFIESGSTLLVLQNP
jgi:hypothetical protein